MLLSSLLLIPLLGVFAILVTKDNMAPNKIIEKNELIIETNEANNIIETKETNNNDSFSKNDVNSGDGSISTLILVITLYR